jgi:hypothetical protein
MRAFELGEPAPFRLAELEESAVELSVFALGNTEFIRLWLPEPLEGAVSHFFPAKPDGPACYDARAVMLGKQLYASNDAMANPFQRLLHPWQKNFCAVGFLFFFGENLATIVGRYEGTAGPRASAAGRRCAGNLPFVLLELTFAGVAWYGMAWLLQQFQAAHRLKDTFLWGTGQLATALQVVLLFPALCIGFLTASSCAYFRADDAVAALNHPHLGTRSPFNVGDAVILSLDQGSL